MIKPRKWIRTSTRKHTSVVVGFRKGAAEPESSSVQLKSEEAEYFHRITCGREDKLSCQSCKSCNPVNACHAQSSQLPAVAATATSRSLQTTDQAPKS